MYDVIWCQVEGVCRRLSGNGKSVYLAVARAGGGTVRVSETEGYNTYLDVPPYVPVNTPKPTQHKTTQ